jgi:hypothetical protein
MKNYEQVELWAASVNADKAYHELTKLREKCPWLKCDETYKLVVQMYTDLPKIINIIKLQEKQNAMHRKFVEVNRLTDEAVIKGITEQYGIKL